MPFKLQTGGKSRKKLTSSGYPIDIAPSKKKQVTKMYGQLQNINPHRQIPPPSPHPYGVLKKGLAQWVSRESVQMYSVPKGELHIRSCD